MKRRRFLKQAGAIAAAGTLARAAESGGAGEIRLIIRADDMASSHAANLACIEARREGIARSIELMVPCPWLPEAISLLAANPTFDVGIHLTLTSEWDKIKWRPLTHAPSLVDRSGYMFASNREFLAAQPRPDEVERELRAQIEAVRERMPGLSHLSSHMGTPTSTPELRKIVEALAAEYRLPLEAPGLRRVPHWGAAAATDEAKEAAFIRALEALTPGAWVFIEHPGLDVPEMRAMGFAGSGNIAEDRAAVTRIFTSAKVKDAIARQGIRLIGYHDLYRS